MDIVIKAISYLAEAIFWISVLGATLFVLRMIFTWANINPFARIPYHLTQWTERMVAPLRFQLGGRLMRFDFVPLIAAAIILITGLFIRNTLMSLGGIISDFVRHGLFSTSFILSRLVLLLGISYGAILFLRILLPYFGVGYRNRFMRFAHKITEPLLKPLRRFFTFGMMDFSAWIALIIIQFGTSLLADVINGG